MHHKVPTGKCHLIQPLVLGKLVIWEDLDNGQRLLPQKNLSCSTRLPQISSKNVKEFCGSKDSCSRSFLRLTPTDICFPKAKGSDKIFMAQPAQAMEAPPAPQNWKSALKLPPKDARIRTEVSCSERATSASWLLMACQPASKVS